MVQMTCKCGKEFLTEADPYIVLPKPSGTELNCGCYLKRSILTDILSYLNKEGNKDDR